MRRELEADRAVDAAGRRTEARRARAGRARRRSISPIIPAATRAAIVSRSSLRRRRALCLFGDAAFALCRRSALPGLRAQWIWLPFWSSTMVAPHSIVVRSPAKRPNRLPSSSSSSRQMYCTTICSGSDRPSRVQLAGAHDLGDDEVRVEGNEQLGAVVVEEAIGAAARGGDRLDRMKDVERRPLEHRRRLEQSLPVGFRQNAALDEACRASSRDSLGVGRIGDLFGAQHRERIVAERHRAGGSRSSGWMASICMRGTVAASARSRSASCFRLPCSASPRSLDAWRTRP